MSRPPQFDRQQALNAATRLFWQQGYSTTSMTDLLTAMGLSRSSFYGTFGDKRQLYTEVLDHFTERALRLFDPINALDEPKAIIECYLHLSFNRPEPELQRGCMLANTVLEQAGLDDELAALAAARIRCMEDLLVAAFERARDAGHLANQHSPLSLARLLITLNQGLRVSARVMDKAYLDDVIQTAIAQMASSPSNSL